MRWNYNPEYRQLFSKDGGVHCDILIVPHATNVTPVEGGPPTITSKIPQFKYSKKKKEYIPQRGKYKDVAFTITNEDIIKEKFEYSYAINSADDLTFSSAESACLKFSIRNLKEFVIDNEETGEGHYESCIPNLQKFEVRNEIDGNIIIGEIESRAIIKLYLYYEGDSSTMIYMGMFIVEEDKVSDDGYQRDITAYDFMATLRDMDIYEWYKRLFKGVCKKDKKGEDIKDSYYPGLKPKDKWTIKDALNDLFTNLAAFDPNQETATNPTDPTKDDLRDYESDEYGGYGMPIMLDPDLFKIDNVKKPYHIPTESGDENDQYECYGYMSILEYEFMCDENIIRAGSLSLGKFLEDIGMLAGRYPCIRIDKIQDGWYWGDTPETAETGPGPQPNKKLDQMGEDEKPHSNYMLYEKCILTFKPLPRKDAAIAEENELDEGEIVKGFKADYFNVGSIMYMEVYNREDKDPIIRYGNLTKEQRKQMEKGYYMPCYIITDNTFTTYLTPNKEKLEDELKKDYKALIDELANDTSIKIIIDPDENPDTKNEKIIMRYGEGYLHDAYKNMKYREYTPCEITTTADPCRDVGDRIKVSTIDRITGEKRTFETYILERRLSGIQNMMDTYTAKGSMNGGGFSDYRSGTKSGGSSYALQTFGYNGYGVKPTASTSAGSAEENTGKTSIIQNITGLSTDDFIEIIRNIGFRLLEEPTKVSINYGVSEEDPNELFDKMHYPPTTDNTDTWTFIECLTELTDESETNPITLLVNINGSEVQKEYTAVKYDTLPYDGSLFVFGKDKKWHIVEMNTSGLVQYPTGDYVFNTPQDGSENNIIDYYYYDENYHIHEGIWEVNVGDQATLDGIIVTEGRSNTQTFLYPGYWWGAGMFPYIDTNFSGEDSTLIYKYNYYGNLELQNGYTTPPGMNELHARTVGGEGAQHLVTALTDESNQNPLVYISSTGDIYSYVRSYCVVAYKEDASETYTSSDEYYIYGSDDKWHLHKANLLKTYTINDENIPDMQTGSTVNKLEIDGNMLKMEYGDYIVRPIQNQQDTEICTYNYPGVWYVEEGSNNPTHYPVETIYVERTSSQKPAVFLKWTDPDDITTNRPAPAIWAGTVVVRKEGSAPRNRWDGTKLIKNVKTRNKYKKKSLIDDTVEMNKKYYYGIFPYDTKGDYRFTKVVSVNTKRIIDSPDITGAEPYITSDWDGSEIVIMWSGDSNTLTVQVTNSQIIFKMYAGNTEIYSFTSLVGSTVADVEKINISFIKDDNNRHAKPSFIYETGTNEYSYNQESPSNSQMRAIYNWLN